MLIRFFKQLLLYSQSSFDQALLIRKFIIRAGKLWGKFALPMSSQLKVFVYPKYRYPGFRQRISLFFVFFSRKYCVSSKFEVEISLY